jgi:hypothetical protein
VELAIADQRAVELGEHGDAVRAQAEQAVQTNEPDVRACGDVAEVDAGTAFEVKRGLGQAGAVRELEVGIDVGHRVGGGGGAGDRERAPQRDGS